MVSCLLSSKRWFIMRCLIFTLAFIAVAADFKDVNPNVFGPDDPRAKALPKMMWADAKRRLQDACLRESKSFAAVTTKAEWEKYRDVRIQKLKESLGAWPEPLKDAQIVVTRELPGDGFIIRNILYQSRLGLWVSANLYLPTQPPAKMPGILISHSHHTPKTHGELQDMGMTWARSGVAVLVPDHLGHGERRIHDFVTEKDYDKPFRVSRQDYYFRYNANLQLSAAGDSLMGWMVWDLMRGVDVLLKQDNIDKDRIILLGAVAGGGDPAGVTAALDPRIACVVPFNFGGWQPESKALENPDRDFAWFGEGYWESTRGLRNGARDGFAHYVIVGSVAPRKVIYAHEFAWDPKIDPAWPRLQKIFDFYSAKDSLRVAHGAGKVTGNAGPDNTHCTHIGKTQRAMIYPALKDWFGMAVPEEYSKRRPAEELLCWTDKAKRDVRPMRPFSQLTQTQRNYAFFNRVKGLDDAGRKILQREEWAKLLGSIELAGNPRLVKSTAEVIAKTNLQRLALEVEPGIIVPFILLSPKDTMGKLPVVLMVAQGGKARFFSKRSEVISEFLLSNVAVCLVDVRGTGETSPTDSSPGRTGMRTSISQTNLMLGQPVIGSQFRDLRTVIRWLQTRKEINGGRIAVWGDSFADVNSDDRRFMVPLDAPDLPRYAESCGSSLALLANLFEDDVVQVHSSGGLTLDRLGQLQSPYLYLPHDAVIHSSGLLLWPGFEQIQFGRTVDLWNCQRYKFRSTVGELVAKMVQKLYE